MKFSTIIFAAIFVFAFISSNAQTAPVNAENQSDDEGVYLFKTGNGYLYVFNLEQNAFQIEVKGSKLDFPDKHVPLAFLVDDDKFINLLFVLNENYWTAKPKVKTDPSENELLEAHKIWERDFYSDRYKTNLSVTSETFNLESGRKVMYWSYPIPKNLEADYSQRNYLTTVVGKNIVGIAGAVKTPADRKTIRNYLTETMNTLKVSDKPFDIEQLRKSYKELSFGEDSL